MKTFCKISLFSAVLSLLLIVSINTQAQDDKSKRPSPPDKVSGKAGEATVSIDYSKPSVKGRTVWGDLVP